MGTKTFRFVDGAKKNEVKFNFSEDPSAQALADWFERISESEQLLTNLEVSAKYDHLGVMKAVLLLESAYDRRRLVDPAQYLPLLDRIAKNESYMHQARMRAAGLADQFRCAATPCAPPAEMKIPCAVLLLSASWPGRRTPRRRRLPPRTPTNPRS